MLRVFASQLIASGLAALVGAGVGGLITYFVITENSRAQLVATAYSFYLPEATRALQLASDGQITQQDRDRLTRATAVLEIHASKTVMCLAYAFDRRIHEDEGAYKDYSVLVSAIRREVLGEEHGEAVRIDECPTLREGDVIVDTS